MGKYVARKTSFCHLAKKVFILQAADHRFAMTQIGCRGHNKDPRVLFQLQYLVAGSNLTQKLYAWEASEQILAYLDNQEQTLPITCDFSHILEHFHPLNFQRYKNSNKNSWKFKGDKIFQTDANKEQGKRSQL